MGEPAAPSLPQLQGRRADLHHVPLMALPFAYSEEALRTALNDLAGLRSLSAIPRRRSFPATTKTTT